MTDGLLSGVDDRDLEIFEVKVNLRCGTTLSIEELTLRGRDALVDTVRDFAEDEVVLRVLEPFAAMFGRSFGASVREADAGVDPTGLEPASDDDPNVAISFSPTDIVQAILGRLGNNGLTRFLSILVDVPANRHIWREVEGGCTEWLLDHIRLSEEMKIVEAFFKVNDVAGYLGNILTPLGISLKETGPAGEE